MTVKPQFQISIMVGAMVFAALLSYVLLHIGAPDDKPPMEKTSEVVLPEATFTNEGGDKMTLADFKGKVLLVNLWATWCTPCVAELPSLEKLAAETKDDDFKVLAISVDHDPAEKVEEFLKDKGLENVDLYFDTAREAPQKWKYAGIPTSFLIDKDGNVVQKFDGPQVWTSQEITDKISALLN